MKRKKVETLFIGKTGKEVICVDSEGIESIDERLDVPKPEKVILQKKMMSSASTPMVSKASTMGWKDKHRKQPFWKNQIRKSSASTGMVLKAHTTGPTENYQKESFLKKQIQNLLLFNQRKQIRWLFNGVSYFC